jgi:hypothetical protein
MRCLYNGEMCPSAYFKSEPAEQISIHWCTKRHLANSILIYVDFIEILNFREAQTEMYPFSQKRMFV